jgi:formate-dependent phosphoribosylglycinamide formyltransferase (GAR transformylase)
LGIIWGGVIYWGFAGWVAVYFIEVSPRPVDAGMVTMISQGICQVWIACAGDRGLPLVRLVVKTECVVVILQQGSSSHPYFGEWMKPESANKLGFFESQAP